MKEGDVQVSEEIDRNNGEQFELAAESARSLATHNNLEEEENIEGVECYRHFGNLIPLKLDNKGNPIYLLGPHSYLTIITILISGLGCFYIIYHLYDKSNQIAIILSIISALFYLYCFIKIGLSSPGLACSDIEPTLDLKITERYCVPCRVVREPGTKHCYYCDVCIYKYDHHCPWVGKCIGRDNICMFYVFLISVTCLMGCLVIAAVSATKMVI